MESSALSQIDVAVTAWLRLHPAGAVLVDVVLFDRERRRHLRVWGWWHGVKGVWLARALAASATWADESGATTCGVLVVERWALPVAGAAYSLGEDASSMQRGVAW